MPIVAAASSIKMLSVISSWRCSGRRSASSKCRGDQLDEVGLTELATGQVDRHRQPRPPRIADLEPPRLPAGFLQHPRAERDDQSGLLGDGDELVGPQQSARRVVPPHERLVARGPVRRRGTRSAGSGGEGHRSRIDWRSDTSVSSRPIALVRIVGAKTADRARPSLLARYMAASASGRRSESGLDRLGRGDRDPGADADDELTALPQHRFRHRRADLVGHADRLVLAGQPLAQHGELVAADPGEHVTGPHETHQPRGNDHAAADRRPDSRGCR